MDDSAEFSSQIVEEEDFFFDEEDEDFEQEPLDQQEESNQVALDVRHPEPEDEQKSFKNLLAGPSTNKAGLGSVDKEKVNAVIYELSKGSKFFEREKKRDEAVTQRINAILAKYELIKDKDLSFEQRIVDNMIRDLEDTRDLTQCICHMDMDAFYASVEELEDPSLKEVPMAVGGMAMLCTSNYLARQYGVRSAMPGFIARKLCPELVLIPLHFPKYREASNKVRAVFQKYDPNFVPMSLDEAYLNLTEYLKTTDLTPVQLVEQIRSEIFEATQLTASAGIACNKTLAKVCSDINKPNGQYYLPIDRASIVKFVKDLRVRQIPGVGRVTERVLDALGVRTCGDIYSRSAVLYKLLSPISFQFMLKSYLGIGSTTFNTDHDRKSMSTERTFGAMSDPEELFKKVKELSIMLEQDLEKTGYMGRNVGIKLKAVTYESRIRSKTFPSYIWKAKDIERIAKELLIKELPINIRLMGIRISIMKPRGSEDESVMKYFTKVPLPEYQEQQQRLNQQQAQQEDTLNALVCPICNRPLKLDNAQFNRHVDECLSKVEVRAILQEEKSESSSNSSNASNDGGPVSKRLKRSNGTKHGKSLLDYYFPS
ncbi:uncharacterized protein ATC70_007567 [Mucor velutinosus]|uniref:DNA polymerase kappa n=1 Tax=Mucor velutinosus TaxID=708070 RepID=A0AAN7D2Z9_9FUNG|nr:hypothetical protein ATC70_007567 [Mucor velutinosus]